MRLKERRRSTTRMADKSLSRRASVLASTVWSRALTFRFSEPPKPDRSFCGLQDCLADSRQESWAGGPAHL
jgi:hypothetical protein